MGKSLSTYQRFNRKRVVIVCSVLAIIGVGLVLITRASVPVYNTQWYFWGPRIRGCESGSGAKGKPNYTAQNSTSTASGAYQFLDSTWAGFGGYAKARLAPPAVQEDKAFRTFSEQGTRPWDASYGCWATNDVPPLVTGPLPTVINQPTTVDLAPLVPGAQDVVTDAKQIKIVSTPPADGLDPWLASPIVQFLRLLGFLRV